MNPEAKIQNRYVPMSVIGTGTYGRVILAHDEESHRQVAIKIAHKEAAYRRSAFNEVNILHCLNHSLDIGHMHHSFEQDGHVHIVMELYHCNMYEYMRDRHFEAIQLEDVADVGRAVLRALSLVHSLGYIHCDVKPENIMQRTANSCRDPCVIDFGAVRKFSENCYFDVQSLWYRAPEVICGVPYTSKIDVWSVGCLLYEMHTGNPLFPGENGKEQLHHIVKMFGQPSRDAISNGKYSPGLQGIFNGSEIPPCANTDGNSSGFDTPLEAHLQGQQAQIAAFAHVLRRLLHPDENQRISVDEALRHPFFTGEPMTPNSGMSPYKHNQSMCSSTGLSTSTPEGDDDDDDVDNVIRDDDDVNRFGNNMPNGAGNNNSNNNLLSSSHTYSNNGDSCESNGSNGNNSNNNNNFGNKNMNCSSSSMGPPPIDDWVM